MVPVLVRGNSEEHPFVLEVKLTKEFLKGFLETP